MRLAYIGNFEPEHSTENEVRKAAVSRGHEIALFQENKRRVFLDAARATAAGEFDMVLWTRTGWQPPVKHSSQMSLIESAKSAGVPTVGFHLDRWWGLGREDQVRTEPFFKCEYVITADGGHQAEFEAAGVNHTWMPPAVSHFECKLGTPREELKSELAFVGSWQPGYHNEWTHRPALIEFMRDTYKDRIKFWPRPGEHAVRGERLQDLYASVDVLIGDSCLAGGATHYWSDRIPETIGRGGYLLHPHVDGIDDHFTPGEHLDTWELWDWDALSDAIDHALTTPRYRRDVASQGQAHVLMNHTYAHRIDQICSLIGATP